MALHGLRCSFTRHDDFDLGEFSGIDLDGDDDDDDSADDFDAVIAESSDDVSGTSRGQPSIDATSITSIFHFSFELIFYQVRHSRMQSILFFKL